MNAPDNQIVDTATARAARGLRIGTSGILPSPWSEAAKGLFHIKGIPALVVHGRRDDRELREWTGAHNVPVVMWDDEPARTHWAEIITLAERVGERVALIPRAAAERARLFGLVHEIAGEDGLGWSSRLFMIHDGITTEGKRGFPVPAARYLAPKYGYAAERMPAARQRVVDVLQLLAETLASSQAVGHRYMLGPLTALDVYLAAFLTPVAGVSEADCPQARPEFRAAFNSLHAEVGHLVPAALLAHRQLMYREHLAWPITL